VKGNHFGGNNYCWSSSFPKELYLGNYKFSNNVALHSDCQNNYQLMFLIRKLPYSFLGNISIIMQKENALPRSKAF